MTARDSAVMSRHKFLTLTPEAQVAELERMYGLSSSKERKVVR
jgi:hypothetical protein